VSYADVENEVLVSCRTHHGLQMSAFLCLLPYQNMYCISAKWGITRVWRQVKK